MSTGAWIMLLATWAVVWFFCLKFFSMVIRK